MGFIIVLILGGAIGWLASVVLRTGARQGIVLDIVIGVAGAFLGSFLANLAGAGGSLSTFHPLGLLWALVGALLLLAAINLIRQGRIR